MYDEEQNRVVFFDKNVGYIVFKFKCVTYYVLFQFELTKCASYEVKFNKQFKYMMNKSYSYFKSYKVWITLYQISESTPSFWMHTGVAATI